MVKFVVQKKIRGEIMKTQKMPKSMTGHGLSQFELSKKVLNNLKQYNLTPTAKLVLMLLVDCYNPENGFVVFPSANYIAETLGVGLTATKQAIKDLILEGLIIKTKRDKVRGNYNKYLLTLKVQNSTSEQSENECFKKSESDLFMITDKKEKKNNKPTVKNNDKYLLQYAEKRGVKNKVAYINAIKKNGGAKEIIEDLKQADINNKWMQNEVKTIIENDRKMRNEAEAPPKAWYELKAKLMQN